MVTTVGRSSDLQPGVKRLPNNISDIVFEPLTGCLQLRDSWGFAPHSLTYGIAKVILFSFSTKKKWRNFHFSIIFVG